MNLEIITKRKQAKNSMNSIQYIETELKSLRNQINTHVMYGQLSTIEDVKLCMQNHVFAVLSVSVHFVSSSPHKFSTIFNEMGPCSSPSNSMCRFK